MKGHMRGSSQLRFVLVIGLVTILLSATIGVAAKPAYARGVQPPAPVGDPVKVNAYLTVQNYGTADGKGLSRYIINGPPTPPPGYENARDAVPVLPPTVKNIAAPTFKWVMGCSAVSGSMIAAYYDRNGYPNIYTGPTAGGVVPMTAPWGTWNDGYVTYPRNPLIASQQGTDGRTIKGSINDYWIKYNSTLPDPYIGHWTQHTWGTAVSDYMKTSQSAYGNTDGSTTFWNYTSSPNKLTCADMVTNGIQTTDGTYGRKLFYQARGYTVTDCYSQKTDNTVAGGFNLTNYKAQINANKPVMLNLAGHTIVGVGYDTAVANRIIVHDTWDELDHYMTWGTSYGGMQLLSVSIVNIKPPTVPTPKTPSGTIHDRTPTYAWYKVASATNYQYVLMKGTTTVYTKTVGASVCSGWNCSNTPATTLAYAAYKWRVRAKIGGVWKAWSAYKTFTIAP